MRRTLDFERRRKKPDTQGLHALITTPINPTHLRTTHIPKARFENGRYLMYLLTVCTEAARTTSEEEAIQNGRITSSSNFSIRLLM